MAKPFQVRTTCDANRKFCFGYRIKSEDHYVLGSQIMWSTNPTDLPTTCDSTYWTLAAQDVDRKNTRILGNLNFNVKFYLDLSLLTVLQITLT